MQRTPPNRRLRLACEDLEPREVPATVAPALEPGLTAEFFALAGNPRRIPSLNGLTPDEVRIIPAVIQAPTVAPWTGLNLDDRFVNKFAVRITGLLRIDNPGYYRFTMQADDGVKMWVDGRLVVNDDGVHGPRPRNADLNLSIGYHAIRIDYFDQKGPSSIALSYAGHDIREAIIVPPSQFAHDPSVPPDSFRTDPPTSIPRVTMSLPQGKIPRAMRRAR